VIPRHKGSPHYQIAHGWKMRMDLLILKLRISSCTLVNRGVHFTHTHIFSFSHISPSFLSFFLSFIFFAPWKSHTSPLNFLPFLNTPIWTLKLHCTHLLPHA
jgi:hypothetical protein